MRAALPLLVLPLVLLMGCDSAAGRGDLVVRVKSDLQPGFEFTEVRTSLEGSPTASEGEQTVRALTAEHSSYLAGREVAVFEEVIGSDPVVRVQVMAGEVVLADRYAIGRIPNGGASVLTVLVTRDCQGVTCPGVSGAANETECVGGACVPRSCTPESPGTCPPPPCSRDSDCTNGGIECAQGRCADGRCLLAADEALCGAGQHCALSSGCVGSVGDSGVPDDAGP